MAPSERHDELRRTLASIEYDLVATVAPDGDLDAIDAEVAVVWQPDAVAVDGLRAAFPKVVAIGSDDAGADMSLRADDLTTFRTRIWELYRA